MGAKQDPHWLVLPVWTLFLLVGAAQRCPAQSTSDPELYGYEVVAEYPHDPYAFTQGTARLFWPSVSHRIASKAVLRSQAWSMIRCALEAEILLARLSSGSQQVHTVQHLQHIAISY